MNEANDFIANGYKVPDGAIASTAEAGSTVDSCGLVRASTIAPHAPEFLWWPYVRKGNLNLFRSNGGGGKTTFSFAFAAAITTGIQPEQMPGKLNIDGPQTVIYLGAEDDLPEYRVMLDLQGANPDNVLMPSGQVPTLGEIMTIEKMIKSYNAVLLILDPIQALLPDGVDMNKSSEVRPVLDGLRDVCRSTGCAALILEHLNKATKAANVYRGSGSMDFFNASRSVLIAGWTPDGRRACGHLKSNGAAYGDTIIFDIDDGRFVWKGADATITGDDIITTRQKSRQAAPNPYEQLIKAIAEHYGTWEGTAAEAVALSSSLGVTGVTAPEAFGKAARSGLIAGVRCLSKRASRGTVYILEALQ